MNSLAKLKTGRWPFLALLLLWAVFVLPSVTQTGYFYIDDPDQLLTAESGSWWASPNIQTGRHLPVFSLFRKLCHTLVGAEPSGYYWIQSLLILTTWIGILWLVRKVTDGNLFAQWILTMTFVVGSLAESAFTLGKHEPLSGFLFMVFMTLTVRYSENGTLARKWSTAITMGVIAMLAVWNKETAMLLPVIPFVAGVLGGKSVPTEKLSARLASCFIPAAATAAGVLLAKMPMFVAKATATKLPDVSYTKYAITSELIRFNLDYYSQQTPEIYVLLGVGAAMSCLALVLKKKSRESALGAAFVVAGIGYVAGLSLWRFALPYYMYPASLLAATGMALSLAGVMRDGGRTGKWSAWATMVAVIPFQAVSACQNLYVAAAQRMATHASQATLDILERELAPKKIRRVFLLNFPALSEPPQQIRRMLERDLGADVKCYGLEDFQGGTERNETSTLFGTVEKTPAPVIGDYIVVFPSEMTGPWHLRAVSPCQGSISQLDSLNIDSVSVGRGMRSATPPILSWRTYPHIHNIAFGWDVRLVTGTNRAGAWTGRWADGWVGKRSVFTPFEKQNTPTTVRIAAFAPTVPNRATVFRNDAEVGSVELKDTAPVELVVAPGEGELRFEFQKAISPLSTGMNNDNRVIAGSVVFPPR